MRNSFLIAYKNPFRLITVATGILIIQLAIAGQSPTPTDETADSIVMQAVELEKQGGKDNLTKAALKYEEALRLYQEHDNQVSKCWTLFRLGIINKDLLQYDAAKKYFEESLDIAKELNSTLGPKISLNLGEVATLLNRNDEAAFYLHQALAGFQFLKDAIGEEVTIIGLAELTVRGDQRTTPSAEAASTPPS